ncbi:hypothetical protein [Saccharopolyspora shandongensis]
MAISETLHIRPWELRERLTVAEFEMACAYIDQLHEEAKKGK